MKLVAVLFTILVVIVGLSRRSPVHHCGCHAIPGGCEEPCVSCCGPNGIKDCFQDPGPTQKP